MTSTVRSGGFSQYNSCTGVHKIVEAFWETKGKKSAKEESQEKEFGEKM